MAETDYRQPFVVESDSSLQPPFTQPGQAATRVVVIYDCAANGNTVPVGVTIASGVVDPTATVTADPGTLYIRKDGANSNGYVLKNAARGTAGWTALSP